MRCLLDTQIIVWALDTPQKLTAGTINLLEDERNSLFVSWISLLEIKLKSIAGKMVYHPNTPAVLEGMNIEIVPLTFDTIANLTIYNPNNKDPFDNIIVTTAIDLKVPLVTSDLGILNIKRSDFRTIDARR